MTKDRKIAGIQATISATATTQNASSIKNRSSFSIAVVASAIAGPCPVTEVPQTVPTVACGSDYFQTEPGTFFTLNVNTVFLQGVPFGRG